MDYTLSRFIVIYLEILDPHASNIIYLSMYVSAWLQLKGLISRILTTDHVVGDTSAIECKGSILQQSKLHDLKHTCNSYGLRSELGMLPGNF